VLRQLARLTRTVEGVGDRALAIAVYADDSGHAFAAAEAGYEGVACVDDAARALVLACDLWKATGLPLFRAWGDGLLDFVIHMQDPGGLFTNFIEDWSGRRNVRARTSLAGGEFWQARGLRGLASATLAFGDPRAESGLRLGLARLDGVAAPSNVRAIHVRTAVELLRGGRLPSLRADLERWSDEIASCRRGDVLFDDPDQDAPHLWGHLQEGALAEAGAYLGRADLVEVARRSAAAYLVPIVESGFDLPVVQPYGVACALYSVERLATVTGDPLFHALAHSARAWFDGRNPVRRPVYDRVAGSVHDGIDDGRLNVHSGAESNIEGALALFDELAGSAAARVPLVQAAFSQTVRERLGPGLL